MVLVEIKGNGRLLQLEVDDEMLNYFLVEIQLNKVALDKLESERRTMSGTKRKAVQILKKTSIERSRFKTCRLCLKFGSKAIFSNEGNLDLAANIEFTLGIMISKDDGGPQFLCSSCESTVEAAAQLKRLAHISQWTLQKETEILAKSQESEESPTLESNNTDADTTDISYSTMTAEDLAREWRRWRCSKCRKTFNTQEKLEDHKQQPCRRPRPSAQEDADTYMCDVCGMKFPAAYRLKVHFRARHGELSFACASCPYRSQHKIALVQHMRVHSGERPLKCPHCPATFVTASNLASHRHRHFPPRHRCDQCQRMFTRKQSLQNHMNSQHSDVKANPCSLCDKTYATRKLLRRHELSAHNCPKRRGGSIPTYLRLQLEAGHSGQQNISY